MNDWDEAIDLPYALRNNPEEAGLTLVACIDGGGGYDWTTFYVFRDITTGALRWWSGNGCSCNQPMDGVSVIADLSTGTERDLMTDLIAFSQDTYETEWLRSYIAAMQTPAFKQINATAEGQKR